MRANEEDPAGAPAAPDAAPGSSFPPGMAGAPGSAFVPGAAGAPGSAFVPGAAGAPGSSCTPGADRWPGTDRWIAGLGRLRDVVRQEVLRSQLAGLRQLRRPPARVLDVGCGQGTQALHLARAGHAVTGIDSSAQLLAAFESALAGEPADVAARVRLIRGAGENAPDLVAGAFDLVLCHGVLMYLDDITPMLTALSEVAAADGAISLLVRNGLATAMRAGLRGDWPAAQAAFGRKDYVNRLGLPARAHAPADTDQVLAPLGWQRQEWFGVRVFTDHLDEPAPEPDLLGGLLAAERQAGGLDPYRSVAALLHLVYGQAS
jgi:S-adenosylmethionine-dependent methyltransferase